MSQVSIGTMMEALGARSYGPFLLVPALVELSPIGGIPGVPTFLAAIVVLFAAQMVVGRRHFWVPGFVARRTLSSKRLRQATGKLRPVAGWLDRWFHGRLSWLTAMPIARAAAAVSICLALIVPPLELVPFASSAPMGAIALFGLAILVRDGALMLGAMALGLLAAALVLGLLLTSGLGT